MKTITSNTEWQHYGGKLSLTPIKKFLRFKGVETAVYQQFKHLLGNYGATKLYHDNLLDKDWQAKVPPERWIQGFNNWAVVPAPKGCSWAELNVKWLHALGVGSTTYLELIRRRAGVSIKDMAEALDVCSATITNMERGRRSLTDSETVRLMCLFSKVWGDTAKQVVDVVKRQLMKANTKRKLVEGIPLERYKFVMDRRNTWGKKKTMTKN